MLFTLISSVQDTSVWGLCRFPDTGILSAVEAAEDLEAVIVLWRSTLTTEMKEKQGASTRENSLTSQAELGCAPLPDDLVEVIGWSKTHFFAPSKSNTAGHDDTQEASDKSPEGEAEVAQSAGEEKAEEQPAQEKKIQKESSSSLVLLLGDHQMKLLSSPVDLSYMDDSELLGNSACVSVGRARGRQFGYFSHTSFPSPAVFFVLAR